MKSCLTQLSTVLNPSGQLAFAGKFTIDLPKHLSDDWMANGRFTRNLDQLIEFQINDGLSTPMYTLEELLCFMLSIDQVKKLIELKTKQLLPHLTPSEREIFQASNPKPSEKGGSRQC